MEINAFLKAMDALPERLTKAMDQSGAIGLIFGVLASREILERSGENEAAQLINRESMRMLLTKVASGDLIMQDQIMTGTPYNPDIEQMFQKIADMFLKLN